MLTLGEYLHLLHRQILMALDAGDAERLDRLIADRDRAVSTGVPGDEPDVIEAEAA